jgi:uracil-DNA glycosylase family 4
MNKRERLEELEERWSDCRRCDLCNTRHNIVFGEGNPDADILVIGEAPGETEDGRGRPFVGPAGEVLNGFVDALSLDRNVDLFVTNTVACRPTLASEDERTGEIRIDNRPPSKDERMSCLPRLKNILYIVDPLLIITLGRVPYQVLFGKVPKMDSVRGNVQTFRTQGLYTEIKYPVMPMYHTAFLLRTHDKREEGPWGKTMADWLKVCNVIDHLREVYYGTPRPNREDINV